jgi:hypothetical protein
MLSPLYGQLSPLRIPTLSLEIPKTVAGLQLWLDATTGLYDATSGGSLVTTDSAAVARWEDRSENARHHTNATLNNRPILKTNQINGKNVVSFDGSNDSLANSSTVFRNVSGYTFFGVRKNRSTVSSGIRTFFDNNDGSSQIRFSLITLATNSLRMRGRRLTTDTLTTLTTPNNNTTIGNFELFSVIVDHTNTTVKLFKNGSLNASSVNFLTSGNTSDVSFRTIIGAFTTGNTHADIDVAEIIVYHGVLSDTDRQNVESYLTNKWGL